MGGTVGSPEPGPGRQRCDGAESAIAPSPGEGGRVERKRTDGGDDGGGCCCLRSSTPILSTSIGSTDYDLSLRCPICGCVLDTKRRNVRANPESFVLPPFVP